MEWEIGFLGYCIVEADSKEEAKIKFYADTQPPSKNAYNSICAISSIEENKFNSIKEFLDCLE